MSAHDLGPLVLAGAATSGLARATAEALGVAPGDVAIDRFPDGELHVELRTPPRGRDVYLMQSTGAPVGEALLELLLIADAARRGGARRMVALLPYVGFARQDRRQREGEALGIAVVADIIACARFERLVAVDLHAPATEGCFAAPLEHVSASSRLAEAIGEASGSVIVAPDAGAARTARQYGTLLGAPVAFIQKARLGGEEVEVSVVVGEVAGRRPILVDDMISTGGTIAAALDAVMKRGARPGAVVVATHLLPSAGAAERLKALSIERVIATDSLPAGESGSLPVERVSLAPLFADVIGRLERRAPLAELLSAR